MREYKLGFTASTVTHTITRGWFRAPKKIDETIVEYHALEKGERVCGQSVRMWIMGEIMYLGMGRVQELVAPFNKHSVTCKACLEKLEARRVEDLEAEVAKLKADADGQAVAMAQMKINYSRLQQHVQRKLEGVNVHGLAGDVQRLNKKVFAKRKEATVINVLDQMPVDTGAMRRVLLKNAGLLRSALGKKRRGR